MINLTEMMKGKFAEWKEMKERYRFMVKPWLILVTLYTVSISAILRANFSYKDDMDRILRGRKGWDNFGRYLTQLLSNFIHGDRYLMDISPLPQLLAVLLVALSGIITVYIITEKKKFSLLSFAALIPLGISPYFLHCLSYKYDPPYMALSVFASIIPLLFYKKPRLVYIVTVVLGSLVMCTTYQASSGIFPMLVVLLCFKWWNSKEKEICGIVEFAGVSAIGYLAGLGIFEIFMPPKGSALDYVSVSMVSLERLFPTIVSNVYRYFIQIKNDFKIEWIFLVLVIFLVFLFVCVRDSARNKPAAVFLGLLTLVLMFFLSFGAYSTLEKPLFVPRGMYGFTVLLAFLGIFICHTQKAYMGKLACLALGWCFFVFSFTYGNALETQKEYADFRMELVIDDLKDLELMQSGEEITVQIEGRIGYAPAIKNMPDSYRIIYRLVLMVFGETGNMWDQYKFFHYYELKNIRQNFGSDVAEDLTECKLPILKDTMYHTIKGEDGRVLIELK